MMNLFFAEKISDNSGVLSREESVHCLKVLRCRKGDLISITDGRGNIYDAVITEPDTSGCVFTITGRQMHINIRNYKVHIAISPVKNTGRFEWFLEKASEIGIDVITPLICERTERTGFNRPRMQRILVSSVKQAGVPILPELRETINFDDFIRSLDNTGNETRNECRLIGYCEGDDRLKINEIYQKDSDIIFLVGPEGDFTGREIEVAKKYGFIPVILGNTRLRTETAGIMACAAISIINL